MNTLEKVSLGEQISDYLCPICKTDDLQLCGIHIDGKTPDLIIQCCNCGSEGETDNSGTGLIKKEKLA